MSHALTRAVILMWIAAMILIAGAQLYKAEHIAPDITVAPCADFAHGHVPANTYKTVCMSQTDTLTPIDQP